MQSKALIILWILILLLITAIYAIDIQYASELVFNVIYIGVVALSIWLPGIRDMMLVAILCSIAIISGFHFSPVPTEPWHALINNTLAIIALWFVTSILVINKKLYAKSMRSEIQQKAMLKTSIDPIITITNQGVIASASDAIWTILDWKPEELVGQPIYLLLHEPFQSQFKEYCQKAQGIQIAPFIGSRLEVSAKNKAGQSIPCQFSMTHVDFLTQNEKFIMIIIHDISELKRAEEKLIWLSSHDELTGVYNRRYFNDQIDLEWRRLARGPRSLSLLFIEIDHFKSYNDVLGQEAGDDCLVEIVFIINAQFNRAGEFLARYGGKEFAVLLPNTDKEGCKLIAERILHAVRDQGIPHPDASVGKKVTVSIGGASIIPTPTLNADTIIKMADSSLRQAQQNGRDCFMIQGEQKF